MPPAWTKSLRFQLTAWYLATLAAILLLASGIGYGVVRASLRRETDRALTLGATQTLRQFSPSEPSSDDAPETGGPETPSDPAAIVAHPGLPPFALPGIGTDALLLRLERADNGRTVAVSGSLTNRADLQASLAACPPAPRGPAFAGQGDDDQLRCLTVVVPHTPYLLQVAAPWDPAEDLLARLLLSLCLVSLLFLLLSGIGSWLLIGRVLRPIDHIVTEAEGLTADRLTPALLNPRSLSDNEIGHLVAAVNRMLTRLSVAFVAQKQFTADASHELRTPLTILRGEFELALSRERSAAEYRRAVESGLEEALRMTRIVESLAFLARGDAASSASLETAVALHEVTEEVVATLSRRAEAHGARLIVETSGAVFVRGDAEALGRMIRNLLENAISYTPPGGQITVTLDAIGGEARLSVTDTGVGIAPDDLPRLFDRFYRADKSRANTGGSGLGLSIVQSIVAAHGGTITVESELGVGSRFTVTLPQDRVEDEKTLIRL